MSATSVPSTLRLGSECTTQGIRVRVEPQYMPQHSKPDEARYIFAYRVTITNLGEAPAKLLSRHWIIVDGEGERRDVKGAGVIGEQPRLGPGESFQYASFCPLPTAWGTMEGTYRMARDDGGEFDVAVGRFYLAPQGETGQEPDPTDVF